MIQILLIIKKTLSQSSNYNSNHTSANQNIVYMKLKQKTWAKVHLLLWSYRIYS